MKGWAIAAVIVTVAQAARAEPPPTPAVGATVVRTEHAPKAPPSPPRPPPDLKLVIETPTTRGPWMLRVTNDGQVPVRIVADARLLSLELTPRSHRTPVRCELPSDMRPADDLDRTLIVPPKRSYVESFEPRLYCFGSKLDALAPGAIVVARLGWTAGPKAQPPFETSPIDGVQPELSPLKSIQGLPVALPDEPTAWIVPPVTIEHDVDTDAPRLSLQGPASVDAGWQNDIEIPVTLRNDGDRAAIVRFRPEVLGFDIAGPNGVEHCVWPVMPAAALREMFTTVAPKASETLSVILGPYCTGNGLDQGGLIVVRPRLDTSHASGATVGLRSFEGQVIAMRPTIVRLHHGSASGPPQRPQLQEEQP
jgi:hypothetical protein